MQENIEEVTKFKSIRNHTQIIYKGYVYRRNSPNEDNKIWRCAKKTCKGRITIVENKTTKEVSHNHLTMTTDERAILNAKIKIKELAEVEGLRHNTVISESTKNLDSFQRSCLPCVETTKHRIRCIRKKSQIFSYEQNYDVPNELMRTCAGNKFLIFDSLMADMNRFIVCMDESLFHFIRLSKTWLGDGTFKSAPPGFVQIFTLHCSIFKNIVPFCYVYMIPKQKSLMNCYLLVCCFSLAILM
jgi:hypothetical protein